jgi:hypothetical protein
MPEDKEPGEVIQPGQTPEKPNVNSEADSWKFQQEAAGTPVSPNAPVSQGSAGQASWTASEFIAHQKNSGWYVMLGVATLLFATLVYVVTGDKVSTAVVIVVAALFGAFAARKPRTLNYGIDSRGINIGSKFYPYELFKSFSVMQDGAFSSIALLPLKRFMPGISIYYPPEQEQEIVSALSNYLPIEERRHDIIDSLMRRLRF